MKKPLVWIAAAAVAIAASVFLWRTVISPPPYVDIDPLSYTDYASWSVIPKEQPPAVWTEGWAVDVFLVDHASALKGRSGKQLDKREQRARLQGRVLEDGLSAIGPVYAPLFRADAKGDDLARAFQIYLKKHNRGRAFVIAADTSLPPALMSLIRAQPALSERFGGFYRLGANPEALTLISDAGADVAPITAYCDAHLVEAGACIIDLKTTQQGGYSVLAESSALGPAPAAGFMEWLNGNVSPMAEPLGDLEEVEIVDIREPGDTDERRARRDDD